MTRIFIFLTGLLLLYSYKITKYDYVFISKRDGNLDLYFSSDDNQSVNITYDKFVDYGIKWSPDGNFILFAKQVNQQNDLYRYNIKLKTTPQLTNDTLDQFGPSFLQTEGVFCLHPIWITTRSKFI